MAAAVALSNYQLGDILGRGASGSVYRALNFLTGETVAIKSISLLSLLPSSLPDIMSEIDLLKNLNHPNIVKYKGFARDKENLFIVLEYCENGSLQSILKKFGKFPESLVAVYISQVLEGLIYLHEQGVIHRDIKGANILTNKDGSVKLADFGVSSRSQQPNLDIEQNGGGKEKTEDDNEVVGSPYWMAPEVIEQSGASTASDIWSVGCVVVELLEGKPPHGDLAPMQALWRIVQDESMRIPQGASNIVKDFLYHCFQRDPNLRVTAKKLLRHPWMLSVKKTTETTPPPSQAPRPNPTDLTHQRNNNPSSTAADGTVRIPSGGGGRGATSKAAEFTAATGARESGTVRAKKPMTVYDEAVQRVQEWNEALNASPKALGTMRRLPLPQPRKQSTTRARGESNGPLGQGLFALPSRSSAEAISSQAIMPAPPQPTSGLLQKNLHVSDVLNRAKESESAGESWDDDFAADITLSTKLGHRREESAASEDLNQKTLRPTRSPALSFKPLPTSDSLPASSSKIITKGGDDDYSDIGLDESEVDLETKLANLKLKSKGRRGLMHPDDIRKIGISRIVPSAQTRSISTPIKPSPALSLTQSHANPSPALPLPHTPRMSARSPPSSRQNSLRGKGSASPLPVPETGESQLDLQMQKYTEEEEEDYSDMFGDAQNVTLSNTKHTDIVSKSQTLQLTQRSNRSWQESEEGDDIQDPFAEIDDGFDDEDLEANLLRDKKATLCSNVNKLVDLLQPTTPSSTLRSACDELLNLLENTPEMGLETHFVSQHGMLAILEVLESRLSRDVAVRLLKLVNLIVMSDVEMLESFCLIGGIPVIIPYTSKKHSLETRLEASTFIQQLTRSALTLQMFISCRGLRILVELLDEDYTMNKTLIISSLEGITSVFDLQSPTPRNDFVRMFVREGILDPLSTSLVAILKDDIGDNDVDVEEKEEKEEQTNRAVGVLLLFCQVAQADSRVREAFANRPIMIRLLKACELLPRKLLITAIKAIKHLSTSPQLIEILQNSNGMEILVNLLGKSIKGTHSNEICSHIFQTIYSMTRLSKTRQEEAASSGIIPLLKRVIQNKSPLKQFALPILCDLANAGKVSRRLLWQNEGMKLYIDLLEDPYWRVSALDAILAWMQDETARVEDVLLEKSASDSLVRCFVHASGVSFEGILDPFLKILRLSASLTSTLSHPPFFNRLADTLERSTKAVIKLNLLRLTRVVCDAHPDRASLVARFGLVEIVEKLSRQDAAVLVRELAKEVLPGLLFGNDVPDPLHLHFDKDEERGGGEKPKMRRTMSEMILPDLPRQTPISQHSQRIKIERAPTREEERFTYHRSDVNTVRTATTTDRSMPPPPLPLPIRSTVPSSPTTTNYSSGRSSSSMAMRKGSSPRIPASPSLSHLPLGNHRPPTPSRSIINPAPSPSPLPLAPVTHTPLRGEDTPSPGPGPGIAAAGEKGKHKRKISRSQLREVQWQMDENGKLKSVRTPIASAPTSTHTTPARLAGYTVE